jgi:flagellar hook-associated protein 2
MASTINLGGFTNIGGKNVSSGIASGLDTKALVTSLVAAKQIPVTKLEDTVKLNTNKLTAYSTMTTLLTSFKDAANTLRNPPGFDTDATNAFKARQVYVSTNTGVAGNTYVGVVADAGAAADTYKLSITNLAVAKSQQSTDIFTTKTGSVTEAALGTTQGQFSAGTFQLNGKDITLTAGQSLIEIQSSINALSSQTNVSASIVQVSSSNFQLTLKSTIPGIANAYTITDPDNVVSNVAFSTTSADDARLTFNNTPIQRSTNTIDDIVSGVTFSLYAATPTVPATTITTEVSNDTESVKSSLKTFIGAYNDFMSFAAKQQEKDTDGITYKSTSYLAKENTLQTTISSITSELSRIVSGLAGKTQLSDIGVTFDDTPATDTTPLIKNVMKLNETTLDKALTTDFNGVRKIFEFDFNASSSKLSPYTRSNALATTQFTADIDTSRATGDQVRITYKDSDNVTQTTTVDYTAFDGGGGNISGKAGTALEGFTMLYSGTGVDTITVNQSQGIGDKLFNVLDGILASDGILKTSASALTDMSSRKNDEITKLNSQIESYRSNLLDLYSRLEDAITKSNSILQMLSAQVDAQNNN